jgi:hypothetical protein
VKVFISWSGPLSEQIARIFREWLPTIIPAAEPWVSSEDIEKGARWLTQLSDELASTSFGIFCLVPENLNSPWLNFEAGALSRSVDSSRVSPFLLGASASDLRGPLTQFQATVYEENDLRRLVLSISKACGNQCLSEDRLDQAFQVCWPWLRDRLDPILEQVKLSKLKSQADSSSTPPQATKQSLEDIHIKILTTLATDDGSEEIGATLDSLCYLLNMKSAKMLYYLETLQDMRLIQRTEDWQDNVWYELTSQGRAFLVENNMI